MSRDLSSCLPIKQEYRTGYYSIPRLSLWKYVMVRDLVILVLTKLQAEAITNKRWRGTVCSSDYQKNWEKSSQPEAIKDYQHCHSNMWWITRCWRRPELSLVSAAMYSVCWGKKKSRSRGLKKDGLVCMSSPLTACMWWSFRGRTVSNHHIQRAQGKWGSVKKTCLGKHEQHACVLLWGGLTDHPSAPGAALWHCPTPWLRCISAKGAGNLATANTYCYDVCGFPPLSDYIFFSLVKLTYVHCSFLILLF